MSDAERGGFRPIHFVAMATAITAPILTILGLDAPPTQAVIAQKATAQETLGPSEHESSGKDDPPEPSDDCTARFWAPIAELRQKRMPSSTKRWTVAPTSDSTLKIEEKSSAKSWADVSKDVLGEGSSVPAFDAMIALLPDPLDSGLGYSFDTQLQALRLGLESEPSLQRAGDWLPWDDRQASDGQRARSEQCRREVPGVILYRSTSDPKAHPRMVLLVGESPRTGPHMRALRLAIELAEKVEKVDREQHARGMSILGPSFSGSAFALSQALVGHRTNIVSPTANGPGIAATLKSGHPGPFYATTVPQSALECAFLHFAARGTRSEGERKQPEGEPEKLASVAILSESDTAFGRQSQDQTAHRCRYVPGVQMTFPLQISTLQREYERTDSQERIAPMGHRTMLDVSLVGGKRYDVETQLSPVTKYAQDRALANVLSQISRKEVSYLGIRATSIADAVFLARKIRDVAPDVRLAFFESDALLLHPEYQRNLLGSLVISPYPFLGADEVSAHEDVTYHPFESGTAVATYNAVRALRALSEKSEAKLEEYAFPPAGEGRRKALPIWISAIGRNALTPLRMIAPIDCEETIYQGVKTPPELCKSVSSRTRRAVWSAFNRFDGAISLNGQPVPRVWYVALALLGLVALVDFLSQRKTLQTFGDLPIPATPPADGAQFDRVLDLSFANTQWRLHAFLRRLCLTVAAIYMTAIQGMMLPNEWTAVCAAPILLLVAWTAWGMWRFWENFLAFRRIVRARADNVLKPKDFRAKALAWIGLGASRDGTTTIQRSYAHLLSTFVVCLIAGVVFVHQLGDHVVSSVDFGGSDKTLFDILQPARADHAASAPSTSLLFVLRSLRLMGGLSPATPILLCLAAIYLWMVSRCARTSLLRSLSTICPDDYVVDGVSTPLRTILFSGDGRDAGFARQERSLVNALSRPSGGSYVGTLVVIAILPVVLFMLEPPSTLESHSLLMFGALGIMAVLVGFTLLQLLQYWRALDLVLKHMMTHPLGPAFARVQPIVREGIDAQVSRFPNDLLRMIACAQSFKTLVVLDRPKELESDILTEARGLSSAAIEAIGNDLADACDDTLEAMSEQDMASQAAQQSKLGTSVVKSASRLMGVLCGARKELGTLADGEPPAADAPPSTSVTGWLLRAESYVATVLALLLNRHVRQFRNFLYTATGSALLLLLAISSYPFEPHRTLVTCIWLVMGAVVFMGLYVFIQLDRDPLLNHIAGTPEEAGHLTLSSSFLMRVLVWVVVPLLSVLAAQYPDLANHLATSVEPLTRSLH